MAGHQTDLLTLKYMMIYWMQGKAVFGNGESAVCLFMFGYVGEKGQQPLCSAVPSLSSQPQLEYVCRLILPEGSKEKRVIAHRAACAQSASTICSPSTPYQYNLLPFSLAIHIRCFALLCVALPSVGSNC